MNAVRFRAAMTRAFRAREARFRRTRDFKRCGVWKNACMKKNGKTKKVENAKGAEGGIARANGPGIEAEQGRGGTEDPSRAALESRECENVLQFRNQACACWFAPKRVTGNRQPVGCGQRVFASAAKADCGSAG